MKKMMLLAATVMMALTLSAQEVQKVEQSQKKEKIEHLQKQGKCRKFAPGERPSLEQIAEFKALRLKAELKLTDEQFELAKKMFEKRLQEKRAKHEEQAALHGHAAPHANCKANAPK